MLLYPYTPGIDKVIRYHICFHYPNRIADTIGTVAHEGG
jgi:hypothetical protein